MQCKAATGALQLGSARSSTPSTSLPLIVQVTESTKFAQKKKQQKGAPVADEGNAAAEPPRRWSDYTVFFEFPEPTELQPPLIQLNDVSFKYPGREDFGLKVTPPGKAWGTGLVEGCPAACDSEWPLARRCLGRGWGLIVHACFPQLYHCCFMDPSCALPSLRFRG